MTFVDRWFRKKRWNGIRLDIGNSIRADYIHSEWNRIDKLDTFKLNFNYTSP